MTQRHWRKKAIVAKPEGSYGVDATPTAETNAMLVVNMTIVPLEAESVGRNLDLPYLGAQGEVLTGIHSSLEFDVEMAGAGTAGAVPPYGPLLRACGLEETINGSPATDVTYFPISEGFESASIYTNVDGVRHKLLGARGNVSVIVAPRQIPYFRFRFMGLFVAATDTAPGVHDISAFQDPLVVSDANTPTFQIAGADRVLESLEVNLGNDVQPRLLVNQEAVVIADRRGSGQAVVEAGTLAEFDPYAWARSRTRVAVQMIHGTQAGHIVQLDLPTVEIGRPSYGNSQGIINYTLPLLPVPSSAGDDEFQLTIK